jgi:hypothetical protein
MPSVFSCDSRASFSTLLWRFVRFFHFASHLHLVWRTGGEKKRLLGSSSPASTLGRFGYSDMPERSF